MKPPRFKRFAAEDYQGAPEWFKEFLNPLSESLGDVAGGLTGRLTRSDNMLSAVEPFSFTSSASTVDTWIPLTLRSPWVNWGSPFRTTSYKIDKSNNLWVSGFVASGSDPGAFLSVSTLPFTVTYDRQLPLMRGHWGGVDRNVALKLLQSGQILMNETAPGGAVTYLGIEFVVPLDGTPPILPTASLKFKNKLGVKPKNAHVEMFAKKDGSALVGPWSETITLNQQGELEVTFQGLENATEYVGVLIYEG